MKQITATYKLSNGGESVHTLEVPDNSKCESVYVGVVTVQFYDIHMQCIARVVVDHIGDFYLSVFGRHTSYSVALEYYIQTKLCSDGPKQSIEHMTATSEVHKRPPCTCSSKDLFNFGCRCAHSKKS